MKIRNRDQPQIHGLIGAGRCIRPGCRCGRKDSNDHFLLDCSGWMNKVMRVRMVAAWVKLLRKVGVERQEEVESIIGHHKLKYVKLEEVMGSLSSTWGLDVFTASSLIRDSRVLTCTTFR